MLLINQIVKDHRRQEIINLTNNEQVVEEQVSCPSTKGEKIYIWYIIKYGIVGQNLLSREKPISDCTDSPQKH